MYKNSGKRCRRKGENNEIVFGKKILTSNGKMADRRHFYFSTDPMRKIEMNLLPL